SGVIPRAGSACPCAISPRTRRAAIGIRSRSRRPCASAFPNHPCGSSATSYIQSRSSSCSNSTDWNQRMGIAKLTHGGLPEGRSTLVAGRSGTGKTIFGLQVATHIAREGLPTLLVGVEETGDDLVVTADLLGLDATGLREDG